MGQKIATSYKLVFSILLSRSLMVGKSSVKKCFQPRMLLKRESLDSTKTYRSVLKYSILGIGDFEKMKPLSNKIQAVLISMVLLSTIGATIVALPSTSAHYPAWTIPTWCYATTSPNPVGVNQPALIVFWTDKVPYTAVGAYGDRWTFTVDVTKPDGSKETLGPTTSDPVGGGYFVYTPTQTGTYSFVAKFPGATLTGNPSTTPSHLPARRR